MSTFLSDMARRGGGDSRGRRPGVCFQHQRGECTRGVSCRYSHDGDENGAGSDARSSRGGEGGVPSFHVETRERTEWSTHCVYQDGQDRLRVENEEAKAALLCTHIGDDMGKGLYHADQRIQHGEVISPTFNGDLTPDERKSLKLKEVYLALGRRCSLVYASSKGQRMLYSNDVVTPERIGQFAKFFANLPKSMKRTGIENTLHRISKTTHAITKETVAITARIGRTIQGHVTPMLGCQSDLAKLVKLCKNGLMLIGPPNMGKTTVLRELARLLSLQEGHSVVVVVDKSLEIAGPSMVPHKAVGHARVLQVPSPELQHISMVEAVENQSPDFVIVDEISNRQQAEAARTIVGRGVTLIASVHGTSLGQIINDSERSLLIGSITSVTLSGKEAEKRPDKNRQVQKRLNKPIFGAAIEMRGFFDWIIHSEIEKTVDAYLDNRPAPTTWNVGTAGDFFGADSKVISLPVLACRQESSTSFGYIYLQKNQKVGLPVDYQKYLDKPESVVELSKGVIALKSP